MTMMMIIVIIMMMKIITKVIIIVIIKTMTTTACKKQSTNGVCKNVHFVQELWRRVCDAIEEDEVLQAEQ